MMYLRYILIQLSIQLLKLVEMIIYPVIYYTDWKIFWIFRNDFEPNGAKFWLDKQKIKSKYWLSYKWNVLRNPVFNYLAWISKPRFISDIKIIHADKGITIARNASARWNRKGWAFFTFNIGKRREFNFSYFKKHLELVFGFSGQRYVFHIKFIK